MNAGAVEVRNTTNWTWTLAAIRASTKFTHIMSRRSIGKTTKKMIPARALSGWKIYRPVGNISHELHAIIISIVVTHRSVGCRRRRPTYLANTLAVMVIEAAVVTPVGARHSKFTAHCDAIARSALTFGNECHGSRKRIAMGL